MKRSAIIITKWTKDFGPRGCPKYVAKAGNGWTLHLDKAVIYGSVAAAASVLPAGASVTTIGAAIAVERTLDLELGAAGTGKELAAALLGAAA